MSLNEIRRDINKICKFCKIFIKLDKITFNIYCNVIIYHNVAMKTAINCLLFVLNNQVFFLLEEVNVWWLTDS